MATQRQARFATIAFVAVLALAVTLLAGCGKTAGTTSTPVPKAGTALGSLAIAKSSMTTTAPDAKLLVVQTAEAATPTSTPVWGYLFGSPANDKIWVVYVANGVSMGAQEYGTAGLSKTEWAAVPGTDGWTVDSDTAYTKALAASGAKGAPAAYMMGLLTFKPTSDTSTVQPFVWSVQFDPGASGATTSSINVDAKTGVATLAE
ncbi:MAG TPA: hypothetical protein VIL06_07605 [Coriobacteriia bacterium]